MPASKLLTQMGETLRQEFIFIIDFIIMSGTYLPYQLLESKIEQGLIAVLSIKEGRHHRIEGEKKL